MIAKTDLTPSEAPVADKVQPSRPRAIVSERREVFRYTKPSQAEIVDTAEEIYD